MFKLAKRYRGGVLIAVVAAAGLLALGAGYSTAGRPNANAQYDIPPASRIIPLPGILAPASSADSPIGLLDTVTGAIYRLRGNLDNPSVRNTWTQRVPPVTGPTSGLLDVQFVTKRDNPRISFVKGQRVFLVDNVTGRSWVLRETSSTNGVWKEIKIFRP